MSFFRRFSQEPPAIAPEAGATQGEEDKPTGQAEDSEDDELSAEIRAMEQSREKAATKIQAIHRGRKTRVDMAKTEIDQAGTGLPQEATKVQPSQEDSAPISTTAASGPGEIAGEVLPSQEAEEREVLESARREACATKIQAAERGRQSRKMVQRAKSQQLEGLLPENAADEPLAPSGEGQPVGIAEKESQQPPPQSSEDQRATPAEAHPVGLPGATASETAQDELLSREKAATKIQAIHRGRVARASEVPSRAGRFYTATEATEIGAGEEDIKLKLVRQSHRQGIKNWEEIFRMVDADDTGRILFDEFLEVIRSIASIDNASLTDAELQTIFSSADDGDGKVDYVNDILPWLTAEPPPQQLQGGLPPLSELAPDTTANQGEVLIERPELTPEMLAKVEKIKQKIRAASYDKKAHDWTRLFKFYDSNNSGTFDFNEFREVIRKGGHIAPEALSDEDMYALFASIDTDGSNSVEYMTEFLPWLSPDGDVSHLEDIEPVHVTVRMASNGKISSFDLDTLPGRGTIKQVKEIIMHRRKIPVCHQLLSMNGQILSDHEALSEVVKGDNNRAVTLCLTDFSHFAHSSVCKIHKPEKRGISVKQLHSFLKFIKIRKESDSDNLIGWGDDLELAAQSTSHHSTASVSQDIPPLRYSSMNMYHAMRWIIKPLAKAHGDCSYVELVAIDAHEQVPQWFVSHAWQNPVVSLVRCIEAHSKSRGISSDAAGYWVCAFASSQKDLDSNRTHKKLEYMPVFKAMKHCMGMLLVLDAAGETLSRIWCCFECSVAIEVDWYKHHIDKHVLFDVATEDADMRHVLTDGLTEEQQQLESSERNSGWIAKSKLESDFPVQTLVNALNGISVETAEAGRDEDKEWILHFMMSEGKSAMTSEQVSKWLRGFFAAVSWRTVAARSDTSLWAKLSAALKDDEFRSSFDLSANCIAGFSNQHLHEIGQALPPGLSDFHLECLSNEDIDDQGLDGLTRSLPKRLKILDLNFTSSTGITDVSMRKLADTLPHHLETLKLGLSHCDKISDDGICALAASLPALYGLDLSVAGCSGIGDCSIEALAELLPEDLEKLSLDFAGTKAAQDLLDASGSLASARQLQASIKSGERPRRGPSGNTNRSRSAEEATTGTQEKSPQNGGESAQTQLSEQATGEDNTADGTDRDETLSKAKSAGISAFLKNYKGASKTEDNHLSAAATKAKMLFGKKLAGHASKADEAPAYESAPPPKQSFGSAFTKPVVTGQAKKADSSPSKRFLFGMNIPDLGGMKAEPPPAIEEDEEEEEEEPEKDGDFNMANEDGQAAETTLRWVPPLTARKEHPQELQRRQHPTEEDENPGISEFFAWAVCRWSMLHELFKFYDHTGRFHNFRNVSAREFVEHVWWHGFEGNALQIFQQIQMESPGPNQGTLNSTDSFGTISLSQLRRFEARFADLAKGVETPATRLGKALMKKRGSMLRAWRLDFDTRGSGLVAYADFIQACRRLGFGGDAKVLWHSFRPDVGYTSGAAPLEFREFDAQEALNLDKFAEALWTGVDFDINKAWTCIDPMNRGLVTLEEFNQGVRLLGFDGNSRLLFRGLDSSGLGKLRRHELDYLQTLSVSVARTQYCAPPIRALSKWTQAELGGPNGLLQKLGLLDSPNASLSVYDLTQNLQILGYRGDAKRTAALAAKIGGGSRINGEILYAVLADVGGHTSSPINIKRIIPDRAPKVKPGRRPAVKESWKGGVDDFAASNVQYPSGLRNYFSTPSGGPAVMLQKEKRAKRREEVNTSPRIRRKRHERPAIFDQHSAKLGHKFDTFKPDDSDAELEDPYLDDPDFADLAAHLAQQEIVVNGADKVKRGERNAHNFHPSPRKGNAAPDGTIVSTSRSDRGDKPSWNDGIYNMSAHNSTRPASQRQYFKDDQETLDLLKKREQKEHKEHHKEHKEHKDKKGKTYKTESDDLDDIKRKHKKEHKDKSESSDQDHRSHHHHHHHHHHSDQDHRSHHHHHSHHHHRKKQPESDDDELPRARPGNRTMARHGNMQDIPEPEPGF